jgi:hypothetical protein
VSWILDTEKELINLDHVMSEVNRHELPEDQEVPPMYGLLATMLDDNASWLFIGTHEECKEKLRELCGKVNLISIIG